MNILKRLKRRTIAVDKQYLICVKNIRMWYALFHFYLWVLEHDTQKHSGYRVYDAQFDDYIDTLGWDRNDGKYSGSYSDELTNLYWLKFWRFLITLEDSNRKYLYMGIR